MEQALAIMKDALGLLPTDFSMATKTTNLIEINIINVEEVFEHTTGSWSYGDQSKHGYVDSELELDEAAFTRILAKQTSRSTNGLIPGTGPFTAPSHVAGITANTVFGGPCRVFMISIPLDQPHARALLKEAVEKKHSMEWWLGTPYAIVSARRTTVAYSRMLTRL